MKFGRTFEIEIITPLNNQIVIRPPFSVQFSIVRNTLASANSCSLTIYNLGRITRQRIYKDRYSLTDYWQLTIKAGYGSLQTLFRGNIYEASSTKQGTEWITKISGFDGIYGIQNGFTARTVSAGTQKSNVLNNVIADMPNMIAGLFGSPGQGSSDRGRVLFGQSSKVLNEETDNQYFIDNETVNIIGENEVITNRIIRLTSDQLLNTPVRRETFIEVESLFIPEMIVGYLCELESKERIYNGEYKILGFSHNVMISGASCGEARTSINLYAGAAGLQGVA